MNTSLIPVKRTALFVLVPLLFPAVVWCAPTFSLLSEIQYNDNLSRTDRRWSGDKEDDTGLRTALRAETGRVFEGDLRLATGVEAGSEMWWSTSGLNNVRPMADAALTRRFGLGPTAPYLRAGAGAGRVFYQESFRDGWVWEAGFGGGRRVSERLAFDLGYRFEEHRARDRFFSSDGHTLFAGLDWAATPRIPVLLGYSFRRGIVHSYTAMEQMGLAPSRRGMQETFDDLNWVYRTRLNSHTLSAGIAPDLTENTSLEIKYDFQLSRGSGFRYHNHIVSAGLFFFF